MFGWFCLVVTTFGTGWLCSWQYNVQLCSSWQEGLSANLPWFLDTWISACILSERTFVTSEGFYFQLWSINCIEKAKRATDVVWSGVVDLTQWATQQSMKFIVCFAHLS